MTIGETDGHGNKFYVNRKVEDGAKKTDHEWTETYKAYNKLILAHGSELIPHESGEIECAEEDVRDGQGALSLAKAAAKPVDPTFAATSHTGTSFDQLKLKPFHWSYVDVRPTESMNMSRVEIEST